jgi:SOS-response transcriptional repressor LexA
MEKIYEIKEILYRLKFAMKMNTWKDVAAFLGEKEGTLSAWKTNNRQSCVTKILYKSRGTVSERYLLTGEGPMLEHIHIATGGAVAGGSAKVETAPEPSNVDLSDADPRVFKVPVISWVQAGEWADSDCQTTPGYAEEHVPYLGPVKSPHLFALRVKHDSMEPEFCEDDVVIVDPDRTALNGSYVIVKNGHEATFKKLVLDGSSVYLKPLNKDYKPIDMTGVEFKVVGVVVFKLKGY